MPQIAPVILHVDLDCFYAAVEHVRLGIPTEKPLAVQQWEGLIAVNYAARAAGVVRHDRVADALSKCADLQLVHVETIGNDGVDGVTPTCNTSKVSLERYRQASRHVFNIFHQHADICERASIDEAYLDVTKKVESFLAKGCNWSVELRRLLGGDDEKPTMVIESGGSIDISDPINRRLLAGAIIAEQIRNDVKSKLGYTCSVGIATNKLLAKIASARNKPNQQTLILPEAVTDLMDVLPLKKVKLLGGKVGEELSIKWNCKTAGEVQKIPLNALLASFGDRLGNYVYKAVRGIHEDKVQEKQTTKSMLAAKSFQATNDLSVVRTWLGVLAEELSVRMWRDVKENHRQPHSLQLYYRSGTSRQSGDHSKSCSMPNAILQLLSSACLGAPRTTTKQKNGDSSGFSENCNSNLNNKEEINLEKPAESDKFIPIVDYSIFNDTVRDLSKPKEDCGGCGLPQEETVRMPAHDCARSVPEESGSENEETVKNLSRLLQQASFDLFQRIDDGFPCTRLAIAASSFHDAPAQGSQSIEHFFGSSSSHVPSVKINTEVSISDDKTVNKQKGMLKYFGSDPSKPFERPLESGMLHHEREDMEKRIQVGILNDETTDNCGGYCVDHNISSLEDVGSSLAFISKENLINSDRSPEDTSDQRGCTTDSHVDLEDIDVDEQCRIWNDIRKMRSASGAKSMPLNDSLVDTTGVHKAKRRKSKPVNPESGQLPLSKFFRS